MRLADLAAELADAPRPARRAADRGGDNRPAGGLLLVGRQAQRARRPDVPAARPAHRPRHRRGRGGIAGGGHAAAGALRAGRADPGIAAGGGRGGPLQLPRPAARVRRRAGGGDLERRRARPGRAADARPLPADRARGRGPPLPGPRPGGAARAGPTAWPPRSSAARTATTRRWPGSTPSTGCSDNLIEQAAATPPRRVLLEARLVLVASAGPARLAARAARRAADRGAGGGPARRPRRSRPRALRAGRRERPPGRPRRPPKSTCGRRSACSPTLATRPAWPSRATAWRSLLSAAGPVRGGTRRGGGGAAAAPLASRPGGHRVLGERGGLDPGPPRPAGRGALVLPPGAGDAPRGRTAAPAWPTPSTASPTPTASWATSGRRSRTTSRRWRCTTLLGDPHSEAVSRLHLGDVQLAAGLAAAARRSWEQALGLLGAGAGGRSQRGQRSGSVR